MRIDLYSDGSYAVNEPEYVFPWERLDDFSKYPKNQGRSSAGDAKDFLWETDRGELIAPKDMATPHLINALNMLWRNYLEIKEDRPEIRDEWSANYVLRAIKELSAEIQRRVETYP